MRDQLSISDLDLAIEQKQAEVDQLTDLRASLVDALATLESLSNGSSPAPPKNPNSKPKKDAGPDLFRDMSDEELADDATKMLQESSSDECSSIRKLVTLMAGGEYTDTSKKRLHGLLKSVDGVKIGRGGSLTYEGSSTAPTIPIAATSSFDEDERDPDPDDLDQI